MSWETHSGTQRIPVPKRSEAFYCLVQDDHIETLGKLMMQHLSLVNAGLDLIVATGCHQVLVRKLVIVDLVAILLRRTFTSIGT